MSISFSTFNFAIAVAGLAVSVLGLMQALASHALEKRARGWFLALFSVMIVYIVCNLIGQFTTDRVGEGWRIAGRLSLFLESVFSSLLLLLLTGFLLQQSGMPDWRRSGLMTIVAALWLAYAILLFYAQFSTTIYYFDELNVYHRGPLYPLLLVPPVLIMLVNLIALWRRRKLLSKRQQLAFAVFLLAPMLAMLIQMLFYGLYLIVFGSSLAALFLFTYIHSDQSDRYLQKEAENAQLRIDIMLSQIQPHFLYNALGAIGHLCRSDPEAKAAINKFSRYLRHNMDSLSQSEPIPFSTELAHAKAYLELEQLRFPGELNVRYELASTDFLLPTLTLQPLVENAVRHGVRGSESGSGTVTISSRETPRAWEVTVSDDGPGFDPTVFPADGETHVGLQNVQERLQRVCGGSLRIDSAPGKGCRATILIPKE